MSFAPRHRLLLLLAIAGTALAESPTEGIHNFYQVDSHVFRGAQPTKEGIEYLAKLGVKTVVDLRGSNSRTKAEEKLVTSAGMKYINIPMTGLTPPTEAETSRALAILEDAGAAVFVHCKRGADRTGAVIAAYRVDHDGWDSARALKEAFARGMSSFQVPRQKYILGLRPKVADAIAAAPVPATAASSETIAR